MAERISVVHDEDCPSCGWSETYQAGTLEGGPDTIGCRKCGWQAPLTIDAAILFGQRAAIEALETTGADLLVDAIAEARDAGTIPA